MASETRRTPASSLVKVAVLALGFGMVGIDRNLIVTLFPVIADDLGLNYSDIGTITGALAIAWGVAALFMGNRADRVGRRKVLVGSMIVFSLLIGFSGLAVGLYSLILIRVVMGLADGAYTPASIAATMDASPPNRQGRNVGLQQMAALLFGLGIAPLVIPSLLDVIDWRWVFILLAPPGLLLAWVTYRVIPDVHSHEPAGPEARSSLQDWKDSLGYYNIRIAMALMLVWLTTLVTVSAFMPNFMIDYLGLEFAEMGTAMSGIGLGGAIGTMFLPWLSDYVGRKQVMAGCAVATLLAVVSLMNVGPSVPLLFAALFTVAACIMAAITLTVGPLCGETVAPHLMATATGLVIAVGEIFGGGIAPIIAGFIAHSFGIESILWLPGVALLIGIPLCLAISNPVAEEESSNAGGRYPVL